MGSCVSKSNRIKALPGKYHRRRKHRGGRISTSMPDVPMRRLSDVGVRDFAVSEFVHLDFEKGGTNSCRRSVSKIHVTQLQWNHSQIEANGKFQTFNTKIEFNEQKRPTLFLFHFSDYEINF